jgi:hypothetical protein
MSPKNVPSCIGKFARSTPHPTGMPPLTVDPLSNQTGTWTPAVLTCAIRQAETASMQRAFPATLPYFHSGHRPRPPEKV